MGPEKRETSEIKIPIPRCGSWKLIRKIGEGGMADVYLAEHEETGKKVAVKLLIPRFNQSSQYQERFRREAEMAQELHHPNIVEVIDSGKEGAFSYFIVMEFMEAPTCSELLEKENIDWKTVVKIAIDVAEALSYVYSEFGIVHRDVKPDNIFFDGEKAKVADLGLAKNPREDIRLTRTGQSMGTPNHMSPEQITDAKRADFRSDIYALGSTIFHLISGNPPYTKGSDFEVLRAHVEGEPLCFSDSFVAPNDLKVIIQKMMKNDPEERYQNYSVLLEDLHELLERKPVSVSKVDNSSEQKSSGDSKPEDISGQDTRIIMRTKVVYPKDKEDSS